MRFEKHMNTLNEANAFTGLLSKIKSKGEKAILKLLRKSWVEFYELVQDSGLEEQVLDAINKHFNTNYSSLEQLNKIKTPLTIKGESTLVEGWTHWWDFVKAENWPAMSFFPALSAWMEINNWLGGTTDFNFKRFGFYAMFWVLLVSGKYLKDFIKWKHESPEDFAKEKKQGKQGLLPF